MAILGRLVRLTLLAFVGVTAVSAVLAVQRKRDAPPPPDADADEIDLVAIFDELDFRSEAQAFRGGRVECWFGGGTLDLRGATLHPDGAVLHTQAIFGGGSVIVPSDWVVTTNVVGIGGAGDARGEDVPHAGPSLTIDGTAVFGGWGILTSDPRVEAPATV
jgi:hypothetical protein